uniref:Uncharacterized protein n=2 Tax=Anguilla anguilla TaxID=7936 RepID=A0A0E9TSE1_ANGAN
MTKRKSDSTGGMSFRKLHGLSPSLSWHHAKSVFVRDLPLSNLSSPKAFK